MKLQKNIAGKEPDYMLHWPYIMAITPYYDEANRTCNRIYYIDGSTAEYPCRCDQILEHLAVVLRTSLEVIRRRAVVLCDEEEEEKADGETGTENAEEICKELRKMPLVMVKDFTLIPVKCRSELVRNSGTLGYVVLRYVQRVKRLPGSQCEILFKYGIASMLIQQQKRGIQKQINLARKLQKAMEAEEQHWQYEICIIRQWMQQRIQNIQK